MHTYTHFKPEKLPTLTVEKSSIIIMKHDDNCGDDDDENDTQY
jgi:hypothetical protein